MLNPNFALLNLSYVNLLFLILGIEYKVNRIPNYKILRDIFGVYTEELTLDFEYGVVKHVTLFVVVYD